MTFATICRRESLMDLAESANEANFDE